MDPDTKGCVDPAPARRWVKPGHLYLVATPIGNQHDVSRRALEVLSEVDVIGAEDTRVSLPWLRRNGVKTPVFSFHEHSSEDRHREVLERLQASDAVALISDAGLPAVADPGQELVASAWDRHIPVVPIPGPSAGVAAFAASGFRLPMVLWGFVPARGRERADRLQEILRFPGAHVIYEAPHRISKTLRELSEIGAGDRLLWVGREMTKLHEEYWRGTVDEARAWLEQKAPRGEFTIVLGPAPYGQDPVDWTILLDHVAQLISTGDSDTDACRKVSKAFRVSRRELYQRWHHRN